MSKSVGHSDLLAQRKRLADQGYLDIQLVSGSMSPVLKTGDVARIAPVNIADLAMRDMVVFWSEDKFICHCVWGHSAMPAANGERMIVTRGLASLHFDYPVRESEILGKVTSHAIGPLAFLWYQLRSLVKARR